MYKFTKLWRRDASNPEVHKKEYSHQKRAKYSVWVENCCLSKFPPSASILSSQLIQILILAILGSVCDNIWTVVSDESAANYTQANTDLFLTDFSTLIAPWLQWVFYAMQVRLHTNRADRKGCLLPHIPGLFQRVMNEVKARWMKYFLQSAFYSGSFVAVRMISNRWCLEDSFFIWRKRSRH